MKIFNIIFIILFVFSAAVQYNDPDPYLWMPIYLFGAYLCYGAFKGRYNPVLYTAGIAIYSLYAIYLFFGESGVLSWINRHNSESLVQTMKATKPWIEETREFFGLLILISVLCVNLALRRKKPVKEYSFQANVLRK
jgi:hypothetical protein